jgi:hypothetical protein
MYEKCVARQPFEGCGQRGQPKKPACPPCPQPLRRRRSLFRDLHPFLSSADLTLQLIGRPTRSLRMPLYKDRRLVQGTQFLQPTQQGHNLRVGRALTSPSFHLCCWLHFQPLSPGRLTLQQGWGGHFPASKQPFRIRWVTCPVTRSIPRPLRHSSLDLEKAVWRCVRRTFLPRGWRTPPASFVPYAGTPGHGVMRLH